MRKKADCAPKYKRFDVEPYLFLFDQALAHDGITAQFAADAMGMTRAGARMRLQRMLYTGALVIGKGWPTRYVPGQAGGCKRVIELSQALTTKKLDELARTNPPGKGAT